MKTARIALLLVGVGGIAVSRAHDGHDHGAPHGGTLAKSGTNHFEVVFTRTGLNVYPLTADHKPVDASRLTGTATFYHPNAPDKAWFQRPIRPASATPGQAPASLNLKVDLSQVPATGAKVVFAVSDLSDRAAPTASFTVPFALAAEVSAITVTKATQADQTAINTQKVCPVSHEDLTSMGGPLKVTRGDKSVLICCKSCLKELQANPDKFFGAPASAATGAHDHKQ